MNAFIKKENYNFIRKRLFQLISTMKNCTDKRIIETCHLSIQDEIYNLFPSLSEDQKNLLCISSLTEPLAIESYMPKLESYVYGMPTVTTSELRKLFKKEKKMQLPSASDQENPHVYLGWIDESIRKLFIVHPIDGKMRGMACRLPNATSKNNHICTLCSHVGDATEVASVSPICKTRSSDGDSYRSISFDICLDSAKCNERIASTEKLEKLLKEVGQIK
ncbi:MAG: FusB/FusC family EF-G-binding protein [Cellulosilyticaceae bacterium]